MSPFIEGEVTKLSNKKVTIEFYRTQYHMKTVFMGFNWVGIFFGGERACGLISGPIKIAESDASKWVKIQHEKKHIFLMVEGWNERDKIFSCSNGMKSIRVSNPILQFSKIIIN